jgi:PAS domain S-box-containing protein
MGLNKPSGTDNNKNQSLIKSFEITEDIFLVVDKNLRITYIDPKAKYFSSIEREKMIGKTLWDIFPLSKEPLSFTRYYKALETGIPQHWERPSKFTDKWAEISAYPLENDGLIIIGRDITEKKRMEFELKESSRLELMEREKEYLEILDSSFLGSFIVNFEMKECYISETWKNRIGLGNMTGKEAFSKLPTIFHPEDINLTIMNSINRKNSPDEKKKLRHVAEYRVKTTDSGYIWVLGQAKIVYDNEGKPIKAYGTHIDITSRKLSEDALRKSERRAQRLTEGLHKENIYKNNFISTLSHELRNPLAAISMGLSLIEHVPPGSEQDIYAREIIKRQTAQLKRLADDLLDVTRAKTNKIKLIKENIEINEIVKKTLDEFRVQFNMKKVALKEKYHAD